MCSGFTAENIGAFSGAWIGSAERKGMGKYNVLDLFAGVGGLSYGFSRLPEFRILAANEIERDIAVAYALNYPDVQMINCDIRELCEQKLRDVLGKTASMWFWEGRPANPIRLWEKESWAKGPTCFCSISGSCRF